MWASERKKESDKKAMRKEKQKVNGEKLQENIGIKDKANVKRITEKMSV